MCLTVIDTFRSEQLDTQIAQLELSLEELEANVAAAPRVAG